MDHKKIKDEYILLIVVALTGIFAATWFRADAIEKGIDTGSANLVFLLVLGCAAVLYFAIVKIMAWLTSIIIKKNPRLRSRFEANRLKNQPQSAHPEVNEEPLPSAEPNQTQASERPKAKPDWKEMHEKELQSKLATFLDFANLMVGPYIKDEDLALLNKYIEYYAREAGLPDEIEPIKTERLTNPDLFHFGWNMAHYFKLPKKEVAPWLKVVFSNLSELDVNYIKGKLHDYQTKKYTIPNIKNIPEYMAEKGV